MRDPKDMMSNVSHELTVAPEGVLFGLAEDEEAVSVDMAIALANSSSSSAISTSPSYLNEWTHIRHFNRESLPQKLPLTLQLLAPEHHLPSCEQIYPQT